MSKYKENHNFEKKMKKVTVEKLLVTVKAT